MPDQLYYVVKTLKTERNTIHTLELEVLHSEGDTVAFLNTTVNDGVRRLEDLSVDCYKLITPDAEPSGKDLFQWVKTGKEFLDMTLA